MTKPLRVKVEASLLAAFLAFECLPKHTRDRLTIRRGLDGSIIITGKTPNRDTVSMKAKP